LLASLLTFKVNAQNQSSTDIADRLKQQGVPCKQVATINRLPYEIEIALQSSSNDHHLSLDDNWFMQLARREATFAYRLGTRLKSYKLTVYNANNELIYSTQTFLYPQDQNQQMESKSPKVSARKTREIVAAQLQLGGLVLDRLDVNLERANGSKGNIIEIHVSAESLDEVNESLPTFLGSLFRFLDLANTEYDTYIVLCHLRVSDGQGNVLLDFVKDLESGSSQWKSVEGIYNDWFPQPSGEKMAVPELTPINSQDTYPSPLTPGSSLPYQDANPYP
jgi:hypothetical protein